MSYACDEDMKFPTIAPPAFPGITCWMVLNWVAPGAMAPEVPRSVLPMRALSRLWPARRSRESRAFDRVP